MRAGPAASSPPLYRRRIPSYNVAMLEVGDWKLRSVINGYYRLDGGAMFGVVPKVLWARTQQVDDQNRIQMATRTLLATHQRSGRIVLVDTGTGSKWPPEKAERFAIEPVPGALDRGLQAIGAARDDVTDVVISHLHFDHSGGMTDWVDEPGGSCRLRYPKAKHWIHRQHWDHAHRPSLRDRASFIAEDFATLENVGVLNIVEGDAPPGDIEDLEWTVSHGHTPGQLLPVFLACGNGLDAMFIGDAVPTSAHLPVTWVMGYDLFPLKMVEERQEIYRRCREEGLALAFPHDMHAGIVSVAFEDDKPRVAENLG